MYVLEFARNQMCSCQNARKNCNFIGIYEILKDFLYTKYQKQKKIGKMV